MSNNQIELLNNIKLRAPICGIFGHVDSGKTSFISKLKSFEILEAGGITQGLSSIFISIDKIKSVCDKIIDLKEVYSKDSGKKTNIEANLKIPGILFIDSPGHEAFLSFRQKASEICDLGIIIMDVEKGVENQTLESIKLLQSRKIPFIIVLTKLDRIDGWIQTDLPNLKDSLKNQSSNTFNMLNVHIEDIKYELSKHEISSEFYFKNKTPGKTYSIIPVSNKSGEGFNDLINFLIFIVQNFMAKKLQLESKPKMFLMEKSFDRNLGWTINIILSNGKIKQGDKIIMLTNNGPISSTIRNLICTHFDSSKNKYVRTYLSEQYASDSIILFAPNLENVLVGSSIFVYETEEEYKQIAEEMVSNQLESFVDKIRTNKLAHYLFTSSESEFEAGYSVLKSNKIEITNGSVGLLNEKQIDMFHIYWNKLAKQSGEEDLDEKKIILYYAPVEKTTDLDKLTEYAKMKGIYIIHDPVIYKLVDKFNELKEKIQQNRRQTQKNCVPVELKLMKQFIFMKGGNSNILAGFKVIGGKLEMGTEIISINSKKQIQKLGRVIKMEKNHKEINQGELNDEICVRLDNPAHLVYQKDFSETDMYICNLDRTKVEILKRDWKTVLNKDEWLLVAKIVKILGI